MAAGQLGMNVSPEYVDLMKTTRDWQAGSTGAPTPGRDAEGWPTGDGLVVVRDDRLNQWWNGPDPNAAWVDISGTYHLSFHGSANIRSYASDFVVRNQVYDAATNVTTADLVEAQVGGNAFLAIDFSSTRNPESPTGAGVSDVKLIRPGYAADTTQVFTTNFLNAVQGFHVLRTLDANAANNYVPSTDGAGRLVLTEWSQRRLPSASSQVDNSAIPGQAWEYQVMLANETDEDLWINVPGTASDDYVANLAALIKNGSTVDGVSYPGLEPGRKVYLEYSNEVWGGIANPYETIQISTRQELASGASPINKDGTTDMYLLSGRRYMQRTMQLTQIFRGAFGADPGFDKVRPVMGWHYDSSWFYQNTLGWFASTYGAASNYFYGIGQATYMDTSDWGSVDAIINSMRANEAGFAVQQSRMTAVAQSFGLKNVSYEGGPSLGSYDYVAGQNGLAASRDPRMADIIQEYYSIFYASGGELAAYYAGPYAIWSPAGSWNAAELGQASNPMLSPKYRGLRAVLGALTTTTTLPTGGTVGDAGFEAVSVGFGSFAYAPTGSPWAFDSYSGLAGNGSGFTGANPSAPSGLQVAFLQTTGSFSQSVSGWAAGTYTIAFKAAQRANWGASAQDFQVLVDGVVVGTFQPGSAAYQDYATAAFQVPDGAHTITFRGLNSAGGDNTALIDSIKIAKSTTLTTLPTTASAGDAEFEAVPVGSGSFAYAPAGSPWAFGGGAGLAGNGSAFTSGNPSAPSGSQVAFLQTTGSFSQSVSGWAAGAYTIAFKAAQRGNFGASAQDFQVLVDGVVVGTFQPGSAAYQDYATAAFTVPDGAHTITFRGLNSAGGDNTAFIDSIKISRA